MKKNLLFKTFNLLPNLLPGMLAFCMFQMVSGQVNAQSNNSCATAEEILILAGSGTGSGTTANASSSQVPPNCGSEVNNGDANGLWYRFTGTGSTFYEITTCDDYTEFDTEISVFTGSCNGILSCVDSNNDDSNCSSGEGSTLSTVYVVPPADDTPYFIYLEGGTNGASGNFNLIINDLGPPACSISSSLGKTDETTPTANDGTITVMASCMGNCGTILYALNGGTPQSSPSFTGLAPGTYTVTSSNSGAFASCSDIKMITINPAPPIDITTFIDDLVNYLNNADISGSIVRSIQRRLETAERRFCQGRSLNSVLSQLNSAISIIESLRGTAISNADADYLLAEIQALIDALNAGSVVCGPPRPNTPQTFDPVSDVADDFLLFPNPANNTINLSMHEQFGKPAVIRIYSMQGQLMTEQNYLSLDQGEINFELSQFANGIYTMMISVDNEAPVVKKFVVQR